VRRVGVVVLVVRGRRGRVVTLADFLLARIADDEAAAAHAKEALGWTDSTSVQIAGREFYDPARVLAECEAKRRIVELFPNHPDHSDGWGNAGGRVLELLALPYADHADYREDEWRP